ncbi:MAG: response regulator [Caulobacteraceae bacterium]|nr:response regulator [Caulobacteraceae bacterium]
MSLIKAGRSHLGLIGLSFRKGRALFQAPTTSPAPALVMVDDDPALLHALSFAFGTQGYDVRPFGDAEALLASPQATEGPICIVLDYKLPGRTGLALLAELRARNVTAPAILITSNPNAWLRAAAAEAGVEIVEKPLLGHTLEIKVLEVLAGGR